MTLSGKQPVAEDKNATFSCTIPSGKSIARYIWKRNGSVLPNNTQQEYIFVANQVHNGQILSCAAVTDGDVISQESNLTLQVYCK